LSHELLDVLEPQPFQKKIKKDIGIKEVHPLSHPTSQASALQARAYLLLHAFQFNWSAFKIKMTAIYRGSVPEMSFLAGTCFFAFLSMKLFPNSAGT
jgi:hypothetical protein